MRLLAIFALLLPAVSWSQITSLPSPACATPTFTVPAGSDIKITWIAPTKNVDGTDITGPITYNLYSLNGPTPLPVPGAQGITGTSIVRSNLAIGSPCYAFTAMVNGMESATLSNTVSVKVVTTPLPPTGVTCTLNIPAGGGPVTGNCTTQ